MRLSSAIGKRILNPTPGGILYKFKGRPRRDTFFFEDIIANYVKVCEDAGFSSEMQKMGQEWMSRIIQELIPNTLLKLPRILFINRVMRKIWANLGLVPYIHAEKKGKLIELDTKDEVITRLIGENHLSIGSYQGVLNTLFESHFECKSASQTRDSCKYVFELIDKKFKINSKTKDEYLKLNSPAYGVGTTLDSVLKEGIFQLKEKNRVYFRGKSINPMENTLLHIFGNYSILMEKVPEISYSYFKDVVEADASPEKKLKLIKTLISSMGYGIVNIIIEDDSLLFRIKNPPYGLQTDEDNWDFLVNTILGYLWLINEKFKIEKIRAPTRDSNALEASFTR
jgi:hypothetical protein